MSVNGLPPLLLWVNSQSKQMDANYEPIYCLGSGVDSGILSKLLHRVSPEIFSEAECCVQELMKSMHYYLKQELGQKLKLTKTKQIILQNNLQQLYELIFYVCLHCRQKNVYISRVLGMAHSTQIQLMQSLQKTESDLYTIQSLESVLLEFQALENNNEKLQIELENSVERETMYLANIKQLQQDLLHKDKQIISNRRKKADVMSVLGLGCFEGEYLDYTLKIQRQNEQLMQYIRDLEARHCSLSKEYQELSVFSDEKSHLIQQLNEEISHIREQSMLAGSQKQAGLIDKEDSLNVTDASRQFNHQISEGAEGLTDYCLNRLAMIPDQFTVMSEVSELLSSCNGSCSLNGMHVQLQSSCHGNQESQEIKEEMEELRKYNRDLMQKLEDVYKSIQSLNEELTISKKKNRTLVKQNRFYHKQISLLRRLNAEFESKFEAGEY